MDRLQKDDEALLQEIFEALSSRSLGDPYSEDGSYASNLSSLPPGLRAMAATHWLDISLTLDSITWHFGEPRLVAETEAGLKELGLDELASCFLEAKELMLPLYGRRTAEDGGPKELLKRRGLEKRADEIDRRAWGLEKPLQEQSLIYGTWIAYTRKHPERVFPAQQEPEPLETRVSS